MLKKKITVIYSYTPIIFQVYYNKHNVSLGDKIEPRTVKAAPTITWIGCDPQQYYTLAMVGK